ncbi:MAG: CPBP family intramembrane glutamic endopeptidase [Usitatibacter sp.]
MSADPGLAPRFGAKQAWLVFLAYLGAQTAAAALAGAVLAGWYVAVYGRDVFAARLVEIARASFALGGIFGMALGGAAAWWLALRMYRREAPGASLAAFGGTPTTWRLALLAAAGGMLLGAFYLYVVTVIFPIPRGAGTQGVMAARGWTQVAWVVLAVGIAPPVEEFVFRGVLWTGFSRSLSPLRAGIVVTLLFVAMHLTQVAGYTPALFAIGAMGIAALVVRIVSGSVVPAILLHLGYNAVVTIAVSGPHP